MDVGAPRYHPIFADVNPHQVWWPAGLWAADSCKAVGCRFSQVPQGFYSVEFSNFSFALNAKPHDLVTPISGNTFGKFPTMRGNAKKMTSFVIACLSRSTEMRSEQKKERRGCFIFVFKL